MTVYALFKPFDVQIDGNGIPMAGATLTFYQTGTLTLQSTYADGGGMSMNLNPVPADSNGLWPPIYLASGFDYKAILKTSAGVTVATRDPVESPAAPIVNTAQPLRSYLAGLTLSTAGSSAIFGVAAGVAADSTNTVLMTLAAALTKSTALWVVGSGNGGLDTGTIANNTWYHVYLIEDSATGIVDVIVSTNAAMPALPTGFTLFRRIGSMKTDGSATWTAFIQNGDYFEWAPPLNNLSVTNPGTTAVLIALSVPLGIITQAYVNVFTNNQSTTNLVVYLSNPAGTNGVPSTGSVFQTIIGQAAGATSTQCVNAYVFSDTSSRIRYRFSASGAADSLQLNTLGYIDTRGRDA